MGKNGTFKDLRDLSFTVDTLTEELRRLKGGPLVKEMIQHFDAFATSTDTSNEMKVYIYSGHDTTVAPILHTLGVFNGLAPPYSSMIIFELFEEKGLQVKISYKNTTDVAFPLILPGCTELCPLEEFIALTSNMRPTNVKEECGLNSGSDPAIQKVT